jgi:hypothetical protein
MFNKGEKPRVVFGLSSDGGESLANPILLVVPSFALKIGELFEVGNFFSVKSRVSPLPG